MLARWDGEERVVNKSAAVKVATEGCTSNSAQVNERTILQASESVFRGVYVTLPQNIPEKPRVNILWSYDSSEYVQQKSHPQHTERRPAEDIRVPPGSSNNRKLHIFLADWGRVRRDVPDMRSVKQPCDRDANSF